MKIRSGFAENLTRLYKNRVFSALLLVASASLTALTLIFEWLSVFAFVSLVPLVIALVRRCEAGKKPFSSYKTIFLWSLVFYIIIYHWFWYLWPMDFLGVEKPMALVITIVCHLGLSLLQSVGTAFVGPLFCAAYKKGKMKFAALIFASAWTLLEYAQSLTWAGVPWARLALSQTAFPAAVQSASLLGSLFIGSIIAIVNGFAATAVIFFVREGYRSKAFLRCSAFALTIILLNLGYGFFALGIHNEKSGEEVRVNVIQGNIGSGDKWADNSDINSLRVYEKITREAHAQSNADIVLWPETVLVNAVKGSSYYRGRITSLARETGSVIFVGAFDSTENEYGDYKEYNAVIAFFPDGSVEESSYKKRHLVPFGEYMPMRNILEKLLPFMTELNMLADDLTPGESAEIIETGYGKAGRLICFDSIYAALARDSVAQGAEYILLSTNDSWYRDSASAYQHNAHAILRAVENRRYIARSASTGISSVISSEGKTTDMLPPLVDGYICASIYTNTQRTLYSYVGDVIVLPCAVILMFFMIFDLYEKKKRIKTFDITEKE